MQILIVGAGSVGRSIARELISHGHDVTLIDKSPAAMRVASVAEAEWILADACEVGTLEEAGAAGTDVVVAASGDDKVNLVVSLLAKTEFGVGRTIARVNNPKNEWMFDDVWGVDVSVSTPRLMTALVEDAVSVGALIKVFGFQRSNSSIFEITLPHDSPVAGRRVDRLGLPAQTVVCAIVRSGSPLPAVGDQTVEAADTLVLLLRNDEELVLEQVRQMLAPR